MTIRLYLVPLDESTPGYRGPKYLRWRMNPNGLDVVWNAMDYGLHPVALVVADVDTVQHNTLIGNSGVVSLPANLDQSIGAALANVQNALEGLSIPSDWVTAGMTYRRVVRSVLCLFQIAQRYHGMHVARLLEQGTLDTTVGQLSPATRQRLNQAAQSMGFDTSGISSTWTMRRALKYLLDQWTLPIQIGGLVL